MALSKTIDVIAPDGTLGTIPAENMEKARAEGYREATSRDIKVDQFKDSEILAGAAGLARGATLGLSDQYLTKTGFVEPETLSALEEANPIASTVGEIGSLLTPGAGLLGIAGKGVSAVTKAGSITEKATRRALQSISNGSNSKIVKSIIDRGIPKFAGSAVEGAAFGAGQLISEEAMGNLDFNAEGVASTVLPSAILSGAVGGIIGQISPVVGAGLRSVRESIGGYLGSKSKDAYKQIVDPVDASLDLIGVTPVKKARLKERSADVVENLPAYLRDKVKLEYKDTSEDIYNKIKNVERESADELDKVFADLDSYSGSIQTAVNKRDLYKKVADELEEKYIKPYADQKGYSLKMRPIQQLYRDYSKAYKELDQVQAAKGGAVDDVTQEIRPEMTFRKEAGGSFVKPKVLSESDNQLYFKPSELRQERIAADGLAKYDKNVDDLLNSARKDAARVIRQEIDTYVNRVSGESIPGMEDIYNRLKSANLNYRTSTTIDDFAAKKIERNNWNTVRDVLVPAGGIGLGQLVGGEEGALAVTALAAGSKYLKSDLSKKVAILAGVEKRAQDLNKMIDKAAKSITEQKRRVPLEKPSSQTAMSKILSESELAYDRSEDGKVKKPSDEQEAFRNVVKNVEQITSDPVLLQKRLENSFKGLSYVAPQTAAQGMQVSMRALEFLSSKLPKNNMLLGTIQNIKKKQKISSIEMGKLRSYLTVIDDPTIVFRKMESGSLDRPSIEALKAVYPAMYERLREVTTSYLGNNAEEIPYAKRIQLGILLDVPADTSMTPDMFGTLQSTFAPKEEEQSPKPGKAEFTNTMQTPNERALNR